MPEQPSGLSTVECLVALTILGLGTLGAAASLALSVRIIGEAEQGAVARRLTADAETRVRGVIAAASGSCAAVSPGGIAGNAGVSISWFPAQAVGGLDLNFVSTYATPTGQQVDSGLVFLPCR